MTWEFPIPQLPTQIVKQVALGIHSNSFYIRYAAIFALLGTLAYLAYAILFTGDKFFPKVPSNVEINKQKILHQLNTK